MAQELRRLELPAEMSSLGRLMGFVLEGARAAALPERQQGHLELVLEEVLVNVMRYAYADGESGSIEVGYAVEGPGTVFVQVSDAGRPFDPLAKEPPDLRLGIADRPIGGLGVFLVKEVTESLTYTRKENRNTLSFRIRSSP